MKILIVGFGIFMVVLGLSLLTSPIIPELQKTQAIRVRVTYNIFPADKHANYEYSKCWLCSEAWGKDDDSLFYIHGSQNETLLTQNVADHFEVDPSQVECFQVGGGETGKDWFFKIAVTGSDTGIGGGSTVGRESQFLGMVLCLMGALTIWIGAQYKRGEGH